MEARIISLKNFFKIYFHVIYENFSLTLWPRIVIKILSTFTFKTILKMIHEISSINVLGRKAHRHMLRKKCFLIFVFK